jgi:hypothetical protein
MSLEGYISETLYEGTPGASTGLLATVPTGEDWLIDEIIATNTISVAATLTVNHGVGGAAATTSNQLASASSCAANAVTNVLPNPPAGIAAKEGDVIRGLQGTASALNVRITGRIRRH